MIEKDFVPKLKSDIEVSQFDDSDDFIVYFNDSGESLKINKKIKIIIDKITGENSIGDIFNMISSNISLDSYDDFENVICEIIIKNGLLEGFDDYNISKSKSIFLLNFNIIGQTVLDKLHLFTKLFFNKFILIFFTAAYFLSHIIFYILFYYKIIDFNTLSYKDILIFYLFSTLIIFFHELGHSTSCATYNIKSKHIGIGLYYFMIVFYADVSQIWKLDKKKRIMIDLSGIYFQMIAGFLLFIPFLFTLNPLLKAGIILNDIGILINLFPFGKFDGYWLSCDFFGISNVNSFAKKMLINTFSKKNSMDTSGLSSSKRILFGIYYILYICLTLAALIFILNTAINSLFNYETVYIDNIKLLFNSLNKVDFKTLKISILTLIYNAIFVVIVCNLLISLIIKLYVKVRRTD